MEEELISVRQAAEAIGLSERSILAYLDSGRLLCKRKANSRGRAWLVSRASLEELKSNRRKVGRPRKVKTQESVEVVEPCAQTE